MQKYEDKGKEYCKERNEMSRNNSTFLATEKMNRWKEEKEEEWRHQGDEEKGMKI